MKIKRKIQAFTLTEVLVVIIISTILIGLALSVLNLVQVNFHSIRKNYQNTTERQLLQQQLAIDMNRYHSIHLTEVGREILFKNPMDSVLYQYSGNKLIRQKDSIDLHIPAITFFYKGVNVEQGQIDAVKIQLDEGEAGFIFVSKLNDAKNAFNR